MSVCPKCQQVCDESVVNCPNCKYNFLGEADPAFGRFLESNDLGPATPTMDTAYDPFMQRIENLLHDHELLLPRCHGCIKALRDLVPSFTKIHLDSSLLAVEAIPLYSGLRADVIEHVRLMLELVKPFSDCSNAVAEEATRTSAHLNEATAVTLFLARWVREMRARLNLKQLGPADGPQSILEESRTCNCG